MKWINKDFSLLKLKAFEFYTFLGRSLGALKAVYYLPVYARKRSPKVSLKHSHAIINTKTM